MGEKTELETSSYRVLLKEGSLVLGLRGSRINRTMQSPAGRYPLESISKLNFNKPELNIRSLHAY